MNWTLVPQGNPVPLDACPPGPFAFNGSLGFRSEYATALDAPRRYQVDAYCFESGEYFWGGAKGTEARGKLMVQPLTLSRAAPSSEPAIAEGEFARKQADHWLDDMQTTSLDAKHVSLVAMATNCIRHGMALAQSSTPPASKGAEERTDADLLRLIAKDHDRLAPNAHHSADTLRQIADRLDSPTPSNDTLQGRGELERAAVAIAKVLGIDLHEQCGATDGESCDSGTCPGALTEDHDTEEHRERIYRMARAALQKDTRHGG